MLCLWTGGVCYVLRCCFCSVFTTLPNSDTTHEFNFRFLLSFFWGLGSKFCSNHFSSGISLMLDFLLLIRLEEEFLSVGLISNPTYCLFNLNIEALKGYKRNQINKLKNIKKILFVNELFSNFKFEGKYGINNIFTWNHTSSLRFLNSQRVTRYILVKKLISFMI